MGSGKRRGPLGPRDLALEVLTGVERGKNAGDLLDEALEGSDLSRAGRALATEIAYGALRWRGLLDWMLQQVLTTPLERLTPSIRNILRAGAYQIFCLDRVPARAAVYESVRLARERGHEGTARLVNAVLRNLDRRRDALVLPGDLDPVTSLAVRLSHPQWLVERWHRRFGPGETRALLEANLEIPPLSIRANSLRCTPEGLAKSLQEEGVALRPGRYFPGAFTLESPPPLRAVRAFNKGLFTVQDESSMLAGLVCHPRPGHIVIDACAAPGGKTIHLAELMGDQGQVLAVDLSAARLSKVRENLQRLGPKCVKIVEADARRLGALYPASADRLLVDAPCSGLGVLRRNPDAKWIKTEGDIHALSKVQLEILLGASPCLKPGGVLVYSVCSLEVEETRDVVESFLSRSPVFRLDDMEGYLPEGLRGQGGQGGMLWLYPHRHGLDGFYLARMRRREGDP
jgi:16S rRNA (cytosine967-C5)-methyltransferase